MTLASKKIKIPSFLGDFKWKHFFSPFVLVAKGFFENRNLTLIHYKKNIEKKVDEACRQVGSLGRRTS
jgi:hypothetical protein